MTLSAFVQVAFLLGLASTLHCWGMCGGILAAFTLGIPAGNTLTAIQRGVLVCGFNVGRIVSYGLAGALAGLLGNAVVLLPLRAPLYLGLQVLAGLILIMTALRLGGWLASGGRMEVWGARLWSRLQPWCRKLIPVDRPWRALALGALWGWIPCGLVYSALAWSASTAEPIAGLLTMLAFGAGTLPGMVGAGLAGNKITTTLSRPALRQILAAMLILVGILGPASSIYISPATHHASPHH
jgi:uncharacterized protein